jgi:hypothetical protein
VQVVDDKGERRRGAGRREGVGPLTDRLEALLGRLLLGPVGRLGPAATGEEDLLQGRQGQRLAGQLETGPLDHLGGRTGPRGGDERGLADAGFTAHEDDVTGLGERSSDCLAVARPSDVRDPRHPDHPVILP